MDYLQRAQSMLHLGNVQSSTPPFYNLFAVLTMKVKSLWAEAFGGSQRDIFKEHANYE